MSISLQNPIPIGAITEFYSKMKEEISNINSITEINNTIVNIKCNQNRDQWLLCHTLKQANEKKLFEQATNKAGKPFESMAEYAAEVFSYKGTSVFDFILVAEQFDMEQSANYISEFGISKTKLLARLKKDNWDYFNSVINNKDEILNNSVSELLTRWFKQEEKPLKIKLLKTSVEPESYDLYYIRARKILENVPEKIGQEGFDKDEIDKLYDFACFLKNKVAEPK